jgi:hypothetical protein
VALIGLRNVGMYCISVGVILAFPRMSCISFPSYSFI